jgi:5-methylcytosine-specific restriction protein B
MAQGVEEDLINKIINSMTFLNEEISRDSILGKGYQVGHSYFCDYDHTNTWYEEIIDYEIAPLLKEYWYDDEKTVTSLISKVR